MKNKLSIFTPFAPLAAFALAFVTLAHAGNEGPHGAPRPTLPKNDPVIAEAIESGPTMLPVRIPLQVVRIHASGKIAYQKQGRGKNEWLPEEQLAVLAPETHARLNRSIEALPSQPLEKLPPGTPICGGSGLTTFTAFASGNRELPLMKDHGCNHVQRRADYAGGEIIQLLSAFLSFGTLNRPNGETFAIEGDIFAQHELIIGFAPSHIARNETLSISPEGVVRRVRDFRNGKHEERVELTLTARVMTQLQLLAQELPDAELITPDKPKCFDVPSQRQAVFRASAEGGKLLPIWKSVQCVESRLPFSTESEFFERFLQGLATSGDFATE